MLARLVLTVSAFSLGGLSAAVFVDGPAVPAAVPTVPVRDPAPERPQPAAAAAPTHEVALTLPCGPVRVRAAFPSCYPALDEEVAKLPPAERQRLIAWLYGTPAESPWPVNRLAQEHGAFHPVAVVAACLRFYFERIGQARTRDGPRPVAVFGPATSFRSPLTVVVEPSVEHLRRGLVSAEGAGKKAYFDPDTNTIGIALDAADVAGFHPAAAYRGRLKAWAQDVWGAIHRTVILDLYHEVTHALQNESGRPHYLSPFVAEGEAELVSGYMERVAVTTDLFAGEAGLRTATNLEQAAAASGAGQLITLTEEGTLLSPFEYLRYARARATIGREPNGFLGRVLSLAPSEFYDPGRAAELYDLAWFAAYYASIAETAKDRDRILGILRGVATHGPAAPEYAGLAALEQEMRTWCGQKDLRPRPDRELLILAQAAVIQADALIDRGKPLSAYQVYAPLLQTNPSSPLLMSYVGDLYHDTVGADRYWWFYHRLKDTAPEAGWESTLGRLRLIDRYAGALWKMGHYDRAAELSKPHALYYADVVAAMRITLRARYAEQRRTVKPDDVKALDRLQAEYEIGDAINRLNYVMTGSDLTELRRLAKDGNQAEREFARTLLAQHESIVSKGRREVINTMRRAGHTDLPGEAWFRLDWRLAAGEVTLEDLGISRDDLGN